MTRFGFTLVFISCALAAGCATPVTESPQRADAVGLRKTVAHDQHFHSAKADQPLPPAFAEGLEAHEYGRYDVALKTLMPLAQEGLPEAQALIGYMFANGEGVPRDDAVAVVWFRKAAEQGNANGQANLGYMYATGRGVARDKDEAMKWYLYAAEQGNDAAQQNLLGLFSRRPVNLAGTTVGIDMVEQRAKDGDRDAMYVLGHSYVTGFGVRQNTATGMEWIQRAATHGSAAAQYRYGRYLMDGSYGLEKSESQGLEWINESAKQGYLEAKQWIEEQNKPKEEQVSKQTQ